MPARRKSGFTLIELLVVIAIIAILAAILFPVFARAREAARKTKCSNNMHECAIALQTYWTDYDATLPSSCATYYSINPTGTNPQFSDPNFVTFATYLGQVPVPTNLSPKTWGQMLFSHMRSRDIMFCPSDNEDSTTATARVSYQWKYAIDRAWWGPVGPDNGRCCKESDFGYNSDQIVFFERAGFHDNKSTGLANDTRINVAYLDTHVRNITLVNCAPKTSPEDTKVSPCYFNGEPWYFNYDQESVRKTDGDPYNPPQSNQRIQYLDPRRYSDMLP
jgi:prepilin-type N-terminal cleavage/methylation domain-containing protein